MTSFSQESPQGEIMVPAPRLPLARILQQTAAGATVLAEAGRQGKRLSVLPRPLLTEPLWHDPRTAGRSANTVLFRYEDPLYDSSGNVQARITRNVEQTNPWKKTGREGSPHGILRYLDLDVVMALSSAALSQGLSLMVRQVDILRWMGYQELLSAPYLEVAASLNRLRDTTIIQWDGTDPDLVERPQPLRILVESRLEKTPGANLIMVHATLADRWIQSLEKGTWQAIDLDAYAFLARNYRRAGLARVLFAYFTSLRSSMATGEFQVGWDAVCQRFNPRKPGATRWRYRDPSSPNSALMVALTILGESGLVEFLPNNGHFLRGRIQTNHIPRLSATPRQMVLFANVPDLTAIASGHQATLTDPDAEHSEPLPPPPSAPLTLSVPPPVKLAAPDPFTQSWDVLYKTYFRGFTRRVVDDARKRGYSDRHLVHAALCAAHNTSIDESVPYNRGLGYRLKSEATEWDDLPPEVRNWAEQHLPDLPFLREAHQQRQQRQHAADERRAQTAKELRTLISESGLPLLDGALADLEQAVLKGTIACERDLLTATYNHFLPSHLRQRPRVAQARAPVPTAGTPPRL